MFYNEKSSELMNIIFNQELRREIYYFINLLTAFSKAFKEEPRISLSIATPQQLSPFLLEHLI